jgi:beta-galactosidase
VGEAFGVEAPLAMWSSVFKPIDAKAVGIIKGGISPGLAFITEQQVGKGKVVMLGSMPAGESGNELMKKLIDNYIQEAKIVHRYDVTEGTLVVPRVGADFKIWIIINMDGRGGSVILPEEGRDLITGEKVGKGSLEVSKYQYRIIRF